MALADPVTFEPTSIKPDPPPRTAPATLPAPSFRPSWDLDGLYLWLGPTGAASFVDAKWDSTFGADATVIRVREREPLAVIGATFGASRYTVHDGGRLWLDAVVGTKVGRIVGVSLGPVMDVATTMHPRFGASVGIWGFVGVTPYARVGALAGSGTFAEIGVHIALPVLRH